MRLCECLLGPRGRNLAFLRSTKTMSSVQNNSIRKRRLYGYSLGILLCSSPDFSMVSVSLLMVVLFVLVCFLQKLKEKAAFRNPDEFYFKMIKSKVVDGVHRQQYWSPLSYFIAGSYALNILRIELTWIRFSLFICRSEANKYSQEELKLMKTQDIGYVLQKVQSEKKVDIWIRIFSCYW